MHSYKSQQLADWLTLWMPSFLTKPESSSIALQVQLPQPRDIKLRHCQFNFPQPALVPPAVKWIRTGDQISRLHGQLRFNVVDSTMLVALRAIANSLQKYFEQWFPESWVDWQTSSASPWRKKTMQLLTSGILKMSSSLKIWGSDSRRFNGCIAKLKNKLYKKAIWHTCSTLKFILYVDIFVPDIRG